MTPGLIARSNTCLLVCLALVSPVYGQTITEREASPAPTPAPDTQAPPETQPEDPAEAQEVPDEAPGVQEEEAPPPGPTAAELATLERLRSDLQRARSFMRTGNGLDAQLIWARVARELPGSLESTRACLSLTEYALERQDPKSAKRWFDRATLPNLPSEVMAGVESLSRLSQRRRALLRRLEAWPHAPDAEGSEAQRGDSQTSIGVLLPLSGPYGRFGQMAKKGLDLAFDGTAVSLLFADTQGKASLAAAEARRLIDEEKVALLLGPVGREETRAAALVSEERQVAMITLSSFPGALEEITTAIRIRFSPGDHARAVARVAVAEMGLKRLAVVYPQSRYGLEALDAFWAEARRLGATLSVVHALGQDVATAKARRRQEIVGVAETSQSALKAAQQLAQVHALETENAHPYEALFLPLTKAVRIREVVRVLHGQGTPIRTHPAVLDVQGRPTVQLLGLYGFNRRSIVDMGDRLTENAIFAVGFAHDPDQPENHRFVNAYLQRYGAKPGALGEYAAAAYDAAKLALSVLGTLETSDSPPRTAWLRALRELRHVRGALGDRTLRPDGRLSGRPALLTVEKDDIRARLPEAEESAIRAKPQKRRKR